MKLDRKLRMGLIGGGPGAFIGEVHRKASRLDGEIELVAGAFDIDPKKSKDMGKNLALDPKRVYSNYTDMIKAESALPAEQRIDFVAVTTPNNWHFPIARDFLKAGFHVMCEKPMTLNSKEAKELAEAREEDGTGLRPDAQLHRLPDGQARPRHGEKGRSGQDPQDRRAVPARLAGHGPGEDRPDAGQLADRSEADRRRRLRRRHRHARGEPGRVHLRPEDHPHLRRSDDLRHRAACVDDDCNCLLKFDNGAKGVLHASQISIGEENNLAIWVHGEKASLEWHQEHPNYLYVRGWTSRKRSGREATATSAPTAPPPAAARASPPATRKPSSKPSPTTT